MVINKPHLLRILYLYIMMSVFSIGYAQESSQKYAYQFRDADKVTWIYLVDPITLESTQYISIPAQEGESIGDGYLSPTGEWLAYRSYSLDLEGADGLNLFNLSTGETIKVIEDFEFPNLDIHSFAHDLTYPIFAWSPNGRYFAFHFESGREQQSTYLYNIDTRTLHHLGGENISQYHLSWSKDGEKLALSHVGCQSQRCDSAAIQIYQVETATIEQIIDVSHFIRNRDGTDLCDIQWNSIGNHLSFLESCYGSSVITRRDLQVINRETGEITAVTHVAPEDLTGEDVFSAEIQSIWLDEVTIFFGIQVSHQNYDYKNNQFIPIGAHNQYAYTLRYTVNDQHSQLLDWRYLVNWSMGKNGMVGYLVQGEPIYLPDQVNPTIPYTMEIARFDGQKLTPIANGSSGCNPQWDDAGKILSYHEHERWDGCEFSRGDAIIFLDETGMHRFPLEETMSPLGWFTPSIP